MRSIAIITITILALEPYRHATFSLFSRRKWTSEVKSIQTVKIYSVKIPNERKIRQNFLPDFAFGFHFYNNNLHIAPSGWLMVMDMFKAEIVAIASSEFNTDRSLKAAIIVHPGDVNQAA
ncbi:unnamed protein product [Brugia timori]|uniref:Dirigent protein n=1 Tax=Brugia timori TaxID=42155 RepID=A0A0R3QAL2_9BILA|nr:unnamed protein product [Brugia timori]